MAALVALGIIALLIVRAVAPTAPEDELYVITQTKTGFRRIDSLSSPISYVVETAREGGDGTTDFNTIKINDGEVSVIESNCSNQVCVEHDPIDEEGEQIVCLPHGLVVEVAASADGGTPLS